MSKAWMAGVLDQFPQEPQASETAKRLRENVAHWLAQRLWSINLAPELVLHDDRHVSSVDRLASKLVKPLLMSNRLTARDVEILSCAAWLHDWGHVGGFAGYGDDGSPAVARSPQDVRKFHGLISQQLLHPDWVGMHGISDDSTVLAAGIICGHHQGWSSFGTEKAKVGDVRSGLSTAVRLQPASLSDDLRRLSRSFPERDLSMAKARLLVSLLRVADGADVGLHRVPDGGAAKGAFLANCVRNQIYQTMDEVRVETHTSLVSRSISEALVRALELSRALAASRSDVADSPRVVEEILHQLEPFLNKSSSLLRLKEYVEFTQRQGRYYADHALVSRVDFRVSNDNSSFSTKSDSAFLVKVCVTATRETSVENVSALTAAAKVVHDDIEAELNRPRGDASVREVLLRAGIRFWYEQDKKQNFL